jgi:pimeloyl-ACP methyl ester carboxylesterase
MPQVDLDGIATYYEQHGAGDPVVLLHGGFCSIETWQAQVDALSPWYRVHAPERPGQGRTPDREGPISFEGMLADTVAYLDHFGLDSVHVVGFSDGAITALMLGMEQPERVRSLVSISANLFPDCATEGGSQEDVAESDAEDPEWAAVWAAYERLSPDGPGHGDVVLQKLFTLWESQPQIDPAALAKITAPTLVLAGDRDSIATDHTLLIARSITGAQLCVVPDAGHMVTSQRPEVVNSVLLTFLAGATSR